MTRHKLAVMAMIGLGLTALAGCNTTGGGEDAAAAGPAKAVNVLRSAVGNDGGLSDPGVLLINSAAEFEARGSTGLANLSVNFDGESLVVLTLGQKPTGGYWARITGVQRQGNTLYVQGLANRPGPDATTTQAITHPYAAVVIPKVNNVQVRSDIHSVVGQEAPQAPAAQ